MKQARKPLFTLLYCCFTQLLLLLYSTLRTVFGVTTSASACPHTSAPSRHFCLAFSFTLLLYSALLSFSRACPWTSALAGTSGFFPQLSCFTLLYLVFLERAPGLQRSLVLGKQQYCHCFTLKQRHCHCFSLALELLWTCALARH